MYTYVYIEIRVYVYITVCMYAMYMYMDTKWQILFGLWEEASCKLSMCQLGVSNKFVCGQFIAILVGKMLIYIHLL